MMPVDFVALLSGFVSMMVVGLLGVPEGSKTGSAKVLFAAIGCAIVMRIAGPVPAAFGALAAKPFAGLFTKTADDQEFVIDAVKYVVLIAAAVGLAFAVRAWMFA